MFLHTRFVDGNWPSILASTIESVGCFKTDSKA